LEVLDDFADVVGFFVVLVTDFLVEVTVLLCVDVELCFVALEVLANVCGTTAFAPLLMAFTLDDEDFLVEV